MQEPLLPQLALRHETNTTCLILPSDFNNFLNFSLHKKQTKENKISVKFGVVKGHGLKHLKIQIFYKKFHTHPPTKLVIFASLRLKRQNLLSQFPKLRWTNLLNIYTTSGTYLSEQVCPPPLAIHGRKPVGIST